MFARSNLAPHFAPTPTHSHMCLRKRTCYFMVHSIVGANMIVREPVQLHLGERMRRISGAASSAKEGKIKNECCFFRTADFFELDMSHWPMGIPKAGGVIVYTCVLALPPPIRPQTRLFPAGLRRKGSGDASIAAQGCAAPTIFSPQHHYTLCHAKPRKIGRSLQAW